MLIDLTQIPDAALKNKVWTSMLLLCLKHAADRKDVTSWLNIILPNIHFLYEQGGMDYIHAAFTYICHSGEVKDPEKFKNLIREELSSHTEETVMTFAEKCEEIGRQKGKQIGRREMQELIAHSLLVENLLSLEKIAKVSKLPLEDVLSFQKELQIVT